jgi:protoporphyrinogen oxidase
MNENFCDVAIIGGGIGGLYLAKKLKDQGLDFRLFEKDSRTGGYIDQISYQDKIIPLGPRIFLHSRIKKLLDLTCFYSVPSKVITGKFPRYLLQDKGLEKVGPKIIFQFPKLLTHLIFSKNNKAEESIAHFFSTRINKTFLETVIEPLCAGIWAADPNDLSMDHLMGGLKNKEFLKKLFKKKPKGLVVFPKGLNPLMEALEKDLAPHIYKNNEIKALLKTQEGWDITTSSGTYKAKKVAIALGFQEMLKLLENSSIEMDPLLKTVNSSDIDVVSFCFSKKIHRPFGSGYLIAKNKGFKTRGVLFDADFFGNETGDRISCFIQEAKDPILEAYCELQKVFPGLENYEKAFISRYPKSIFQCHVGVHEKLMTFQENLASYGLYLIGAYPKVGVADVLDKSEKIFQALNSCFTHL